MPLKALPCCHFYRAKITPDLPLSAGSGFLWQKIASQKHKFTIQIQHAQNAIIAKSRRIDGKPLYPRQQKAQHRPFPLTPAHELLELFFIWGKLREHHGQLGQVTGSQIYGKCVAFWFDVTSNFSKPNPISLQKTANQEPGLPESNFILALTVLFHPNTRYRKNRRIS
ncbi:hypothetical protein CYPRO_3221 [Cyclonatronum proteinivorum]|uniref:Uncharacterized protein n=1 Tax=Cyclonatronum proteinivorum TaxID=1457365 RepID=A0A345UPQ2_9BACT|nr:hypothetical protein CYPRO_3221 [Cyclonatronum proteinivorum]